MQTTRTWHRLALATLLIALSVVANAQSDGVRIGKKGEIELAQPTRVGPVLLKPGHYEAQHAMVDGQHFVVFREQIVPTRRHSVVVTGDEVARVPCRMVPLQKPARYSFASWTKASNGEATVTELRIADEAVGHIIALEPVTAEQGERPHAR